MGMFKVAVDAGVKSAAIDVQQELARHLEQPMGAVRENLDDRVSGGRWGGGSIGALAGGLLGGLGGYAAGGGAGGIAGGSLGALLGGGTGAYIGDRMGREEHKRDLEKILTAPDKAREDATRLFTPGATLSAILGGTAGGMTGYNGAVETNRFMNGFPAAFPRPTRPGQAPPQVGTGDTINPYLAAAAGAITGAGVPLLARSHEMEKRRALIEQLVGTQG